MTFISSTKSCSVSSESSKSILLPLKLTFLAFKFSLILTNKVLEFGLQLKSRRSQEEQSRRSQEELSILENVKVQF